MNRLETLLELYSESPEDSFVIYGLALEYINSDLHKARSYFDILLKEHPDYLATYYQAGKLYEKLALSDKALDIYNTGIQLALKKKDFHTESELQSAKLQLNSTPLDEDDSDDW